MCPFGLNWAGRSQHTPKFPGKSYRKGTGPPSRPRRPDPSGQPVPDPAKTLGAASAGQSFSQIFMTQI